VIEDDPEEQEEEEEKEEDQQQEEDIVDENQNTNAWLDFLCSTVLTSPLNNGIDSNDFFIEFDSSCKKIEEGELDEKEEIN
jgi:hypothetical protein